MKYFSKIILAAGLAALAGPAAAAESGFAVGTTNGATTLSYVVVPVGGPTADQSCPRVQYINAQSDVATASLQFFRVTSQVTATYTNSTTRIMVNTTNTGVNWQSGTIVIRHNLDSTYEKRTLAANTGATNLVVTAAPLGTVIPGDEIYYCVTTGAGTINWGAATNSIGPTTGGIYVGQRAKPLLMTISATAAGALNVVSGDYIR